ncbi:expressed protein [Phakopsora pachyrhizi]|uniref:Expressed protein n=1 Tax=Phakopsora pachyrhizi TaxID=170000 RepID=A0AAV0BG76_PHAPC|nr:expressed protein [Phakopsora pachyrhizi]
MKLLRSTRKFSKTTTEATCYGVPRNVTKPPGISHKLNCSPDDVVGFSRASYSTFDGTLLQCERLDPASRKRISKRVYQPSCTAITTKKLYSLASQSSFADINPTSPNLHRTKKIPRSFRAGPYKGALLSDEGSLQVSDSQPMNHEYSPSQLRQALRTTPSQSVLHFAHSQTIKSHLEELLYPMKFSEQLACRVVSSKNLIKSQDSLEALQRERDTGFVMLGEHNTKLSFIGRRMMHFALSSFLIHAPTLKPLKNPSSRLSAQVLEDALLTKFVLGQYVGHQWELEKVMRWRELEEVQTDKGRHGTGLWTARGHAVEAIVGAVMTHHVGLEKKKKLLFYHFLISFLAITDSFYTFVKGTRQSLAVFNSLVLPHLSFRLDPAYLPAIRAVQAHDCKLENPTAGLLNWSQIDISSFSKESISDEA